MSRNTYLLGLKKTIWSSLSLNVKSKVTIVFKRVLTLQIGVKTRPLKNFTRKTWAFFSIDVLSGSDQALNLDDMDYC